MAITAAAQFPITEDFSLACPERPAAGHAMDLQGADSEQTKYSKEQND
jgi:hypothetical protein